MRRSVRMLSALLAAMMMMAVLFGCGGGQANIPGGDSTSVQSTQNEATATTAAEEPARDVELTFMGWQPDLSKMNDTMIPFLNEKYPNIKIKPQILDWFAYWDKLTVETAAGEGPDIAAMDVDHLATFYDYMEPLDGLAAEVIGSDWKLKYTDGVIDSLKVVDDQIKMLPCDTTGLWYLFYNKTLLDEMNVSAPTGEYANLAEFVKKINASGKNILPMAFAGKEDVNVGFFWSWLASNNQAGILADAATGKAKFTDAAFVKAFEQIKKMRTDKIIDDRTFGLDAYPGADSTFKNRQAASYLTGEWSLGGYLIGSQVKDTPIENDQLGVVVLKNIEGGVTIMQKYVSLGYSVNKNSKFKKEAVQAAQEWTLGKAAQGWVNYQACVPAGIGVSIDAGLYKTDEAKKTAPSAVEALAKNKAVLRSTLNPALDNKIGEMVVSVLRKDMKVEDALKQLQLTAESE
jgi:raffinose/stachyose/melibiose transport system substrate-binding protein